MIFCYLDIRKEKCILANFLLVYDWYLSRFIAHHCQIPVNMTDNSISQIIH